MRHVKPASNVGLNDGWYWTRFGWAEFRLHDASNAIKFYVAPAWSPELGDHWAAYEGSHGNCIARAADCHALRREVEIEVKYGS